MPYDRSIIAAYLYLSKPNKLYDLTYLNMEKEKRIKRWCQQLDLETKGPENHLEEPSLVKFKNRLTAELADRLNFTDFLLLTQRKAEETLKSKTEQEILDAIKRMIATYKL